MPSATVTLDKPLAAWQYMGITNHPDGEQLMVLEHFAREPRQLDRTQTYKQWASDKPVGLWVSVKGMNDWPFWCEGSGYNPQGLMNRHLVTLAPDAKILHLDSPDAVREFDRSWRDPRDDIGGDGLSRGILWQSMSPWYDGIIIAPYCYQVLASRGSNWYYNWDCSSGCIWNLDAIAEMSVDLSQMQMEKAA